MSTWTCKRVWAGRVWARLAVFVGLVLSLPGCLDGAGGAFGFRPPGSEANRGAPLRQVSFFGGDVVVAGPRGYCIDPDSVRRGAGGGFALLTSCFRMSGQGDPVAPVVMTVSVSPRRLPASQPSAAELTAVHAPARQLEGRDGDGITLVHLDRGGDAALPGGDPRHWRAAMVINNHLLGLALYAPEGQDAAGSGGQAILLQLAETLRANSPVKDFTPEAPGIPATEINPAKTPAGRPGIFGGLFPNRG